MAEVDLTIKFKPGTTQKELEKIRNLAREMRKESVEDSARWKRAAATEVRAKEEIIRLNDRVATSQGKMMKSYFTTGEALRKLYMEQRVGDRTMRESAGAVQNFTNILGGTEISNAFNNVINNFQTTEFSVKALGIAAEGAGGKVGKLGKMFVDMGPAMIVPAALAVTQIMLIKDALDKTEAAAKGYRTAMIKAGLLGEREELIKEYGKVQGRYAGIPTSFIQKLVGQYPWLAMLAGAGETEAAQRKAEIRSQLQPGVNLGGGVHTWGTVLGEETITGTRKTNFWDTHTYTMSDYYAKKARERAGGPWDPGVFTEGQMIGSGYIGSGSPLEAGFGISQYSRPAIGPEREQAFGRLAGVKPLPQSYLHATPFTDAETTKMYAGVVALGGVLANSLTDGFQRGFQSGENVLKTFTQSALAAGASLIAQQLAAAGVAGILSLIPGLGSFGSLFGKLGGLFGGESSGSPVGPGASTAGVDVTGGAGSLASELHGLRKDFNSMQLRVDNVGLYMGTEKGRIAFNNR